MQRSNYIFLIGDFDFSDFCSGPQKVSKNLFSALSDKFNVLAFTYFQDGKKYGYLKKFFGIDSLLNNAFISGVFPILKNIFHYRPKVVHITGFRRFTVVALFLKRILKYKLFYTVNGIVRYENKFFRKESKFRMFENKIFEKLIFRYSDDIFYLSDDSLKMIKYYFPEIKADFHLVENGIEKEFFNAAEVISNCDMPLRICFSSDVNKPEKGFDFLAEAIDKINFPVVFTVFSDDDISRKFKSNIKVIKYNIQSTHEYISALRETDIFITASYYDNFNLSLVEAMALGKVPVATKQTGASRFISDGINGFTYNYGDSDALINILTALNYDRNQIEYISANAIKIYDVLSWNEVIKKYINVYNKYLAPNG